MNPLVADRKLLNPKFEGYKFDPLDQDQIVSRFPLTQKVSQSTSPSRSVLSFHEVQSRITHNHLTVSTESNRAIYVDEDFNLVSVVISDDCPVFRIVYELPKPVKSNDVDIHPEYPSSVFLSDEILALSDGHGSMCLLRHNNNGLYQLLGTYQSPISSPFRIHSGCLHSSDTATILFSSRIYGSRHSTSQTKKGTSAEYEIWAAKLDIPDSQGSGNPDNAKVMDILWRREGEEPPIFTTYDSSNGSFVVIGGSVYREHGDAAPYTPSPDEIAPIPRATENLDERDPNVEVKPHPYSWIQTSDSVTVAFPLPSTTQKPQIHVRLTSQSLSLTIDGVQNPNLLVPLPKYSSKPLWDRIQPSTSYWTWDREAEHAFGLLSLHLDKQNEGTKWMHVFASAGITPAAEADAEDMEVPETLDPSELWHIRESLEKYTAALMTGEDASGLGLGRGVSSLAKGEMDEELDASVGRNAFLSWFGRENGSRPSWAPTGTEINFQLLSLPVPGGHDSPLSLIVKEGVDGVVYTLRNSAEEPRWVHSSTFSAIAFVLAAKRDVRFTFHSRDTVYALENGSLNRGGNAYIYRSVSRGELWAKQAILRVSEGSGGSLLGMGALVVDGTKKRVLVCLQERELTLLRL
ncbi:hypothetical protein L218DRAFT_920313 [Marasmius fiardii PR-910]|nr:hypothetical protein L218DRAFT_920313 [Marasmius fiardii PR-910]